MHSINFVSGKTHYARFKQNQGSVYKSVDRVLCTAAFQGIEAVHNHKRMNH